MAAPNAAITAAVSQWQAVNLPKLQEQMYSLSREMTQRVDASDESRKHLVEQTKEFRKSVPEDVRKLVGSLLKLYQGEIDSLSKRAKAAENAFLTVYTPLSDAPDPAALVRDVQNTTTQSNSGSSVELQEENRQLREKLAQLKEEISEVTNQEVTIKALKDQLRQYKQSTNDDIESALNDFREQVEKQHAEQVASMAVEKEEVEKQLQQVRTQMATVESARNAVESELFELKTRYEEQLSNQAQQMEMLLADAEKQANAAASALKERDNILAKLNQLENSDRVTDDSSVAQLTGTLQTLETEIGLKDKEITRLIGECQKLHAARESESVIMTKKLAELEENLQDSETECTELRQRLDTYRDYEEVKQQLTILKNVEFSEEGGSESNKPLEMMLLEKNKRLTSLVAEMNVKLSEREMANRQLSEAQSKLMQELASSKKLAESLEADMAKLQKSNKSSAMNSQSSLLTRTLTGAEASWDSHNNLFTSMTTDETGGDAVVDIDGSALANTKQATPHALSMVDIISNQRDRFRDRNDQLEAENRNIRQQLSHVTAEVEGLKGDNVKLYEKIKFLQSYQGQAGRQKLGNDQTLDRYSRQYEEQLNPFQQFNESERVKKYAALSAPEKATLSLTKLILSNKQARFAALPMDEGDCLARMQQHMLEEHAASEAGGH